jgi:transposase-like protein
MGRAVTERWLAELRGSRSWTEEEGQRGIEAWEASGESVAAFARRVGLVPQRVYWWRRRLGAGAGCRTGDCGEAARRLLVRGEDRDLDGRRLGHRRDDRLARNIAPLTGGAPWQPARRSLRDRSEALPSHLEGHRRRSRRREDRDHCGREDPLPRRDDLHREVPGDLKVKLDALLRGRGVELRAVGVD